MPTCDSMWTSTIELPEAYDDVGHTLVHYLFTGNYETLQSQTADDQLVEFKRNVNLHSIATKYGLSRLTTIARENLQKHAEGLAIFDILDTAREVYRIVPEKYIWRGKK